MSSSVSEQAHVACFLAHPSVLPLLTLPLAGPSIQANSAVEPCVQVVILSQVLACDTTLGYEDYCNVQLLKFNGTPVNNLRHLTELVKDCTETYMRFDLAYQVTYCHKLPDCWPPSSLLLLP